MGAARPGARRSPVRRGQVSVEVDAAGVRASAGREAVRVQARNDRDRAIRRYGSARDQGLAESIRDDGALSFVSVKGAEDEDNLGAGADLDEIDVASLHGSSDGRASRGGRRGRRRQRVAIQRRGTGDAGRGRGAARDRQQDEERGFTARAHRGSRPGS